MNAHALLTSQGWRGTGHSLHPTSDITGLSRPLLVSKKDNTLGVGKKQHRTSDMWWMNAFDSSLKSLDTSKEGQVVQTNTSQGLDMVKMGGGKYVGTTMGGGLYASFVRGEVLGGTIEEKEDVVVETAQSLESAEGPKKRRKSEKDSKAEKQARKDERQERRARKAVRRAARENKSIARREKSKVEAISKSEDDDEDSTAKTETNEERKERRRLKKLAKEAEKNYITLSSEKAKKKKRRKDS